jgi:hypothetical protein
MIGLPVVEPRTFSPGFAVLIGTIASFLVAVYVGLATFSVA